VFKVSYVRLTVAPFSVLAVQDWSIKVTAMSLAARKLGLQLGTFVEACSHFSVLCCPV
jgi:hypothetical protein